MTRYIAPLTIITVVFGFIHFFIFNTLSRSISDPNFIKILAAWFIISLLIVPAGFLISISKNSQKYKAVTWYGYIWLGFFTISLFFALVESVASIFISHEHSYWVLVISIIISIWALYKGLKTPVIIQKKIKGPESMRGFSLVQISDLHVGLLHHNEKWLMTVVEKINSVNAEAVAITGDLVEGSFARISPVLECLKNVKCKSEKFYITGNHEYIHGSGPWERRLTDLGYISLHNENRTIRYNDANILVAGVPDRMVNRFNRSLKSLPDVALKTNQDVDYRILLAHEPASVLDIAEQPCDLILSGHTHGGQIFPFSLLVRLQQPIVKGFKRFGNILVFAHQGTGLWGPPMRWFTRNEIVVHQWE